jgi:hypothetical protein
MNLDSLVTETGELTPIEACLNTWHQFLSGDVDALDRILADDVVLHSPVLFKPVDGKDLVKMYLTGAAMSFGGAVTSDEGRSPTSEGEWDGRFRYVRKVVGEHDAILEFETTMASKYVNGVDMITCNDDGKVVDFKVMVRPRQAVDAVRELMSAALDTLQASD